MLDPFFVLCEERTVRVWFEFRCFNSLSHSTEKWLHQGDDPFALSTLRGSEEEAGASELKARMSRACVDEAVCAVDAALSPARRLWA